MQEKWILAPGGAVFGPLVLVSAHPPPKIRRKLPFTETWIPEPPNMLHSLSGWHMKDICHTHFFYFIKFTFEVPFNGLFAPTSRSRMSNIFRDTESLGKSNGKKWSQIWKLWLIKGVKSPRKKKLVLGRILPYWAGFFWYQCFSLRLTVFFPPLREVKCPNFLDLRNPWGKVMERSGLRFENFWS